MAQISVVFCALHKPLLCCNCSGRQCCHIVKWNTRCWNNYHYNLQLKTQERVIGVSSNKYNYKSHKIDNTVETYFEWPASIKTRITQVMHMFSTEFALLIANQTYWRLTHLSVYVSEVCRIELRSANSCTRSTWVAYLWHLMEKSWLQYIENLFGPQLETSEQCKNVEIVFWHGTGKTNLCW